MFTVLLIACINDQREKKWPTYNLRFLGEKRFGDFRFEGEGQNRPSSSNNNAAKKL